MAAIEPPEDLCRSAGAGTPFRLVVTGGLDFVDRVAAFAALDALHERRPISTVLTGDHGGAHQLAQEWASIRAVAVEVFKENPKLRSRAGSARNQRMLDAAADACVVFPGFGDGADCNDRAVRAHIPVWRPYGWRLPELPLRPFSGARGR